MKISSEGDVGYSVLCVRVRVCVCVHVCVYDGRGQGQIDIK